MVYKLGLDEFVKILFEAYRRLVGRLGDSVFTRYNILFPDAEPKPDLFTEVNKVLREHGYDELTWDEFREYLRLISDEPRYFGKIYIAWLPTWTNKLEPIVVVFYKEV